ncbi:MAG: hypothetical protein U1C56_01885 [Candidatus Curtissbacteria bacterium]|nr:hypothetical protein [bacterium]MDZ4209909.1 hypothetical protein [Candidatus Curtissbacteria bacterium]
MKESIIQKIILAILAFILFVLGMVGFIQYVGNSQQNTWVCTGGEWLKQGNPQTPRPTTGCGE